MTKLNRAWGDCDPRAMAFGQSRTAIMFAFEDAKKDIEKLLAENKRLQKIIEESKDKK